ncbi:neurofilament heavy polypeptide-like [Dermacentor albipictus]|uniref:neurofilament heavy polypeptide-like n=1 Tax=Dermacentor albipictus TaxID=60249 RepID=UPI0031FD2765
MSKQDRPSRKRHDSVADPGKSKKGEDDSGLGTSKSRTRSSGTATGAVPKSPAAVPSRPPTRQSRAKSTPSPKAPGTPVKSALKRAVGSCFRSPSPKPPSMGASPTKVAARTAEWAIEQSEATAKTVVQGPSGPVLRVYHEPKLHKFDNRGEVLEVFPPEVLEKEGIPKKAPLAVAEDVSSPTIDAPDSPIPSTSFTVQATIEEPPSSDPSQSPQERRYPRRQPAKKKGEASPPKDESKPPEK